MNKKRLLKLADLLEADAKNKNGIMFDMGTFGWVEDEKKPVSCGTQACAMGLAGLSGAFKRAGLAAQIHENGSVGFRWNGRKVLSGFTAAERLFEIGSYEANDLFGSESVQINGGQGAAAELAVAKRIRQFVKTGEL